jgi:hypothetical protein
MHIHITEVGTAFWVRGLVNGISAELSFMGVLVTVTLLLACSTCEALAVRLLLLMELCSARRYRQ